MNRRKFLTQTTSAVLAASACSLPRALAASTETVGRKNILLIYVEQLQQNVASFNGGPAKTPNLEKFAAQSVNFRGACTTAGLCSPSRAALMTGRLGHRTGLEDNCTGWHGANKPLSLKETTLIEWTRKKDYVVGYYGKWHLGIDGPILRGAQEYPAGGFDRVANPGKARRPDFSMAKRYYGKKDLAEKPGFYSTAEGAYEVTPTRAVAQNGAKFLAEAAKGDKPFFLTLSFNAVHPPYQLPRPYSEMYDWRQTKLPINLHDTFTNKPSYQNEIMWPFHDTGHMSDTDWQRCIAFYHGYVTMLDRGLGEVFDALQASGQADNTLVVVVADHGDMTGAHNRFDKGPYCYDEVMRIPLLVRWPGAQPRVVERHVHNADVNQTIVEWAGLKPDNPNIDSRSLKPLIDRGDAGWHSPDESFYFYELYNGLWWGVRAIRTKQFKYCFNPAGIDELYDLGGDPGELENLIDTPAMLSRQKELQQRLLTYLEQIGDVVVGSRLRAHVKASTSEKTAHPPVND